jgi:hypothetical protein
MGHLTPALPAHLCTEYPFACRFSVLTNALQRQITSLDYLLFTATVHFEFIICLVIFTTVFYYFTAFLNQPSPPPFSSPLSCFYLFSSNTFILDDDCFRVHRHSENLDFSPIECDKDPPARGGLRLSVATDGKMVDYHRSSLTSVTSMSFSVIFTTCFGAWEQHPTRLFPPPD